MFIKLVHCAFAQRRKTMINSLFSTNFKNLSKEELNILFEKLNIGKNVRAEQLDINDFIRICDML